MEGISETKLAELKTAFMAIDKDQSGAISAEELKAVMEMVGQPATDEQVEHMISNADCDENGKVEFPEFVKMMKKLMHEQQIREAFQALDSDGSGKITVDELKEIMKAAGVDISEDQIDEMIKQADSDGDGSVNYEEFLKVMGGQ